MKIPVNTTLKVIKMCRFFSCILTKYDDIYYADDDGKLLISHDKIIETEHLNTKDELRTYLRVEITPKDGNVFNHNLDNWTINLDTLSDYIPDWYLRNKQHYDTLLKQELKRVFKEYFAIGETLIKAKPNIAFYRDCNIENLSDANILALDNCTIDTISHSKIEDIKNSKIETIEHSDIWMLKYSTINKTIKHSKLYNVMSSNIKRLAETYIRDISNSTISDIANSSKVLIIYRCKIAYISSESTVEVITQSYINYIYNSDTHTIKETIIDHIEDNSSIFRILNCIC